MAPKTCVVTWSPYPETVLRAPLQDPPVGPCPPLAIAIGGNNAVYKSSLSGWRFAVDEKGMAVNARLLATKMIICAMIEIM